MARTIAEIMERADALYLARQDTESVRACVEELRAAPRDYEILWRLGRALFFLGQESARPNVARDFHGEGLRCSQRAASLKPERVEGHFWLGVNQALLAQLSNPLRALLLAVQARRSLKRAVHLDASYHGAGPLRVLARLESRLPFILGGGTRRARDHFERAISLAPANTVTRLYFAEMLIERGEMRQAQRELSALLAAPHDPAWAFEIARDKRLAQEMLKKIGRDVKEAV